MNDVGSFYSRCYRLFFISIMLYAGSAPLLVFAESNKETTTEQKEIDAINKLSSSDGPEIQSQVNSSELTGVMVDRTITMAGKTFYRAFGQHAMGNRVIGNATIIIRERPDARWGSQVWVMEGNRIYFNTQLSPRINEADRTAAEAVQVVEKELIRQKLISTMTSDKDLGSEELFK